ncbi:MAG TPA: hypothetical protein VLA33_05735 [Gemmatimonadota bacterium]|nr:hypothetical protein [Gemmatimonadota bacterium]
MSSDWTSIVRYDTLIEAELAGGRLESADIPFLIDQHDAVGLFGPGHSGASTRGITLKVPADFADDARMELDLDADTDA